MEIKRLLPYLCEQFSKRSEALGYKGKRRDDMAMEFFVGAANAIAAGSPGSEKALTTWILLMLATRGFGAVEEQLEKAVAAK